MSKIEAAGKWFAGRRKAITAGVGVVAGVAVTLGLSSNHWVQLGIAVATVLGVYTVPNKPTDG
jgi:hypothetical protein